MSHQHDDNAPVEDDPTGMRAMLASLPDPGPMPDDLVERITAALAAEAPARHEGDEARARVVPLPRRVRMRHLGVAAAVVGVLGLGGYLVGSLPGGVTAQTSAGSADSAAVDDSATGSKAQEGAPLAAPRAGSGEVVAVMSGVDHTSARLDVTARRVDDGTLEPIVDLAAESPSLGPIATPVGARACADALGVPADAGILVDVAEVDGVPAAVLVVHAADGRTAWAVERSCTTGNTGLIRGPVSLD